MSSRYRNFENIGLIMLIKNRHIFDLRVEIAQLIKSKNEVSRVWTTGSNIKSKTITTGRKNESENRMNSTLTQRKIRKTKS